MKILHWYCKKFSELSTVELYNILQLRNEIFVVEQLCVYNDTDGKDIDAYHLFAYQNNIMVAYSRLLPPNVSFTEASIGRVLTAKTVRKNGFGVKLMQKAILQIKLLYATSNIKIGAQLYLQNFYKGFGFVQVSACYVEDGIEHIDMLLTTNNA